MQLVKEKKIGQGAFGSCFRVRSSKGDVYALKEVLLNGLSASEQDKAIAEVRVLARLRHAGVVACLDAFIRRKEASTSLCIVMDFADGGDLASALKNANGFLGERTVLPWIAQLSNALAYVHEQKVIHRDLKPANILISKGVCKIADFGIATIQEYTMANAFTRIGTLVYMAPEMVSQTNGFGYSASVDLWALGCVCYELVSGQPPFQSKSMAGLVQAILHDRPKPLKIRTDINNLIEQMLCKNPRSRPSAAQACTHPSLRPAAPHKISETVSKTPRTPDLRSPAHPVTPVPKARSPAAPVAKLGRNVWPPFTPACMERVQPVAVPVERRNVLHSPHPKGVQTPLTPQRRDIRAAPQPIRMEIQRQRQRQRLKKEIQPQRRVMKHS